MKTETPALSNAMSREDGIKSSSDIGITSNVPPESIQNRIGVSSGYVPKEGYHWFVLRATYGRSEQAYDAIIKNHIEAYIPKRYEMKLKNGKKMRILKPLLPNLIFVYALEETVWQCLKTIPYLRFYRDKTKEMNKYGKHPPLTVGFHKMMSFIRITRFGNEHVKLVDIHQCHYKSGDRVKIIDGEFSGVIGRVARVDGQQRVVVEIEGLCLLATAYNLVLLLKE